MRLTKYTHACIVLEEQGQCLIIDPGSWAADLPSLINVVGVVITHEHFDHFDPENVQAILQANPDAKVFTTQEVTAKLHTPNMANIIAVTGGEAAQAGPFALQFFGRMHALVTNNKPIAQNIGVRVNNNFYYPGDALTLPGVPVKTLALPVSGPWLKTTESLEFMLAIKPQLALPTHDALLSDKGEAVYEKWYQPEAVTVGIEFMHLAPGASIEV